MSNINLTDLNKTDYTSSIGDSTITLSGIETALAKSGSQLSESGAISLASASTATAESALATALTQKAEATAINNQYASSSGARLVNFSYSEGTNDSQRRAFFQLKGDTSKLKAAIVGDAGLTALLNTLESSNGFTSFILTGLTENQQEKQSIMSTVDDYFISTFSGQEPRIMNISGILPFDTEGANYSWFLNYLNAYMFLFRASILAKYQLQLKLILNDFSTYICYPIGFTGGLQASQDNMVQFQMNMVVVQEKLQKATGVSLSAKTAVTTADKVAENEAAAKSKQVTGENSTPKAVGTASTEKNVLTSATKALNAIATVTSTVDGAAKAINTINKTLAVAKTTNDLITQLTGTNVLRSVLKY